MLYVASRLRYWGALVVLALMLGLSSTNLVAQGQGTPSSQRKLSEYLATSTLWAEALRAQLVEQVQQAEATTPDLRQWTFALAEPGRRQTVYLGRGKDRDVLVVIDHIDLFAPDSHLASYDTEWSPLSPESIGLEILGAEDFCKSDGTWAGERLVQLLTPLYVDYRCEADIIEVYPLVVLSEDDKQSQELQSLITSLRPVVYRWEGGRFVRVQPNKQTIQDNE